jgi:photosystem II stability/assembly factor-like uncharacterized protein
MKKIANLKKRILSILMVMVISGTMSFVIGQTVTPASHTECERFIGTLTFSIRLEKLATYQWYTAPYRSIEWVAIKGATSNILSLTFTKLQPLTRDLNRQQFRCLVTPYLGKPTSSDVAYLYVNYKPSISAHPVSATKYAGESVTFSVAASGSLPRYYQWQLNTGGGYLDIEGATSSSHTISAVVPGDAGDYRCIVTNDCGTAYSNGATLTVLEPLFSDGWFAQSSGTSKDIRQISAISKYNAWAVTSETDQLLHTIDGGGTWSTVYMVDAGANALSYYGYCIWFSSSNNGYVGGWDGYAYTTNGGSTWTRKDVKDSIDLSDYFYTYDIYFYNTSIGWIVGTDGLIAYTSDGGANWTKQNWGKDPVKVTDADLKCIYFLDSQNGWIGGANGVILATTDGGAHWTLQSAPETQTIMDIHFVSATKGFAVAGYNGLYLTENAGTNWVKYTGTLPYFYAYTIDFVDVNTGWMAGYGYKGGGVYGGSIMRTNDGGSIWYSQSVEDADYLYHIAMVDQNNGWAIGRAGSIQRTAYGGCLHPTMNLYNDQALCASSNYIIIADTFRQNDNVFYAWNTGATSGKLTVSETGTYSVIVTNLCGETATDSVKIVFYPLPVAYAGEDVSICPGDTVQLNATGGANYSWTPGYTLSDPGIQNPRAFPYATTTYTVSVTDTNFCAKTDQVTVTVPVPYGDEEICLVSVDPETEKNMVIWEKTPDVGIEYYYIYRESNVAGIYNIIGSVPVDSLSVFVDEGSNPKEQQYIYKISAVDTCGTQSELSPYHKTILLQYDGNAGGVNLRWDKYEIEGVPINFDSYIIYRGSDSTKLTEVKTISASLTSWIDTDPVANSIKQFYRIAGVKGEVCDPANLLGKKAGTGPYSHSMSNIEDNRLQVGINNLRDNIYNLNIYPNPFRHQTRITYSLNKPSDVKIEIFNLLGARTAEIANMKQDPGEFYYDLNAPDLGVTEGIFYLRFTVNGNTTVKKLILTK